MGTKNGRTEASTRDRLQAQLDGVVRQLQMEGDAPTPAAGTGDFLDVAQVLEQQALTGLVASRLAERARRLETALTRLEDGEYGVCVECGEPIAPKRLRAIPDATTCLACQDRLERAGAR
jgi:RNA polymerase-binding transcription factor DksA